MATRAFFAVLVLRSVQLVRVNPYPTGYTGVRRGMGAFFAFVGACLFGVLGLSSLVVFFTRKKQ